MYFPLSSLFLCARTRIDLFSLTVQHYGSAVCVVLIATASLSPNFVYAESVPHFIVVFTSALDDDPTLEAQV
jgi:hypothetical protein